MGNSSLVKLRYSKYIIIQFRRKILMGIVELNAEYIYIYKSITKRSQEEVNGQ